MTNKKEQKPVQIKRYCSHCGRELEGYFGPAEKFGYLLRVPVVISYKKFNYQTGKRNLIATFKCPKYNSFFSTNHDYFSEGEPFNR